MEEVKLVVKEDGPRAVLTATRRDDGRGLYRAWLVGAGGRCLLGTMAPEGSGLSVRRTLSIDELRRAGAWPPERAEAELSFAFPGAQIPDGWMLAAERAPLFRERALSRAAGELGGLLVKKDAGGFLLAAPYQDKAPFPMVELFCFARLRDLGGKAYAVFCFDENSWPCFPNNGSGQGSY